MKPPRLCGRAGSCVQPLPIVRNPSAMRPQPSCRRHAISPWLPVWTAQMANGKWQMERMMAEWQPIETAPKDKVLLLHAATLDIADRLVG